MAIIVGNVFENLQNSLSREDDLPLLRVLVHFLPLSSQLQSVASIDGLVSTTTTRVLEE